MKKYLFYSIIAILACVWPCSAAEISWSSAFEIETDEDIDVDNEIVRAVNVALPDVGEIEVEFPNGKTIEFEPEHTFEFNVDLDEDFGSGGNATGDGTFYSEGGLTTENEDLDRILDSHGWAGGGPGAAIAVVELTELTVGTAYQIQLVGAADDRGCCEYRQMQIVTEDFDEPVTTADGDDLWFGRSNDFDQDEERGPGSVIGTFTADSTEQLIKLIGTADFDDGDENFGNGNDPGLSMYVLSLAAGVGVPGDYNGNGMRDVEDLDLQAAGVAAGDLAFDLNGDGSVNFGDREEWISLTNTYFGDSNFDGEFSSADFVTVFVPALYETGQAAGFAEGDWNGDGVFNSSDFVTAFASGGYEKGPLPGGLMTVPEPSSLVLLLLGVGCIIRRRS